MKILHVARPAHGGVGRMVSGLANVQAAAGLVPYVATQATAEMVSRLRDDVRLVTWEASRSPTEGLLREIADLSRIIEQVRPDIVHLHSSKAGLVGRVTLRGRLPTVFQPHGWSWMCVDGVRRAAALRWERRSVRWTSRILCVSRDEQRCGEREGIRPQVLAIVPNGVDPAVFHPRDQASSRRDLGLRDVPTVVMVGRLSTEKGADLLLDAWPEVVTRVPEAHLVLVGEGPARAELEKRAVPSGSVSFVGWQSNAERWYSASDVVVLPSRREAMALSPLEGMASARCVVGFDVDGFRESLGDAVAPAAVAPRGDCAALAALITRRLTDSALARREGRLNRTRAAAGFGIDAVGERVHAVYRRSVAAPRPEVGLRHHPEEGVQR